MTASTPSGKDSSPKRRISSNKHRLYIPPADGPPDAASLPARELHHALHVLRLGPDDCVLAIDGRGHIWHCRITQTGRHHLAWKVMESETVAPPPWQITLLHAMTRHKSMDLLVQKATELGAARLVPLVTERVVVKVDAESDKLEKHRWIAIDAMKQSGNAWLPQIDAPIAIEDWLDAPPPFDLVLLASLEKGVHPRQRLDDFQVAHGRPPDTIACYVGPEGDFADAEREAILRRGAWAVTLGPLVLRSETAAIYLLSTLSYELQWRAISRSASVG